MNRSTLLGVGFRCVLVLTGLVARPISVWSQQAGTPSIQITAVSAYGAVPGLLSGRVLNVDPAKTKITVLAFVSGLGYYTKPLCDTTTTDLSADGSFQTRITTGGTDETATRFAVLAVPRSATVPCYSSAPGIPQELERQAVTETVVIRPNPNEREIQFANQSWAVKANRVALGPGGNLFSDSPENVFVDSAGRLHLRIANRGGAWYCAEVVSRLVPGYGTYSFQLQTATPLDSSVVFGAFSWADAELNSRELDTLEIGKFGRLNDPTNAQTVVQPFALPGHLDRWTLPPVVPTVHTMTWSPDKIVFRSFGPGGSVIHDWTFSGDVPRPDSSSLNFRFNLWLYNAAPPTDGKEAEVIINSFSFNPPPGQAGPIPQALVSASDYGTTVSTGSLFTLFGTGLSQMTAGAAEAPLPLTLGGVSARINGIPAPLLYVSPTQMNGQIPYEALPGSAVAVVENSQQPSSFLAFNISPVSPAFFRVGANRCLVQNRTGELNSPDHPAQPSEIVTAYLTGIGDVDNPVPSGAAAPNQPLSRPRAQATATLENMSMRLLFLGLAPTFVGLAQANLEIPPGAATGDRTLALTMGDVTSSPCTVSIKGTAPRNPPPTIARVTPISGPQSGGTLVVISGSGFLNGVTVKFGTALASAVTVVNSTSLQANTPPGTGTVSITVTNSDGQSATVPGAFTYQAQPPSITSISPVSGPAAGGTMVTISGAGFVNGATVKFGSAPSSQVVFFSSASLQATTPSGTGVAGVTVMNPDGQSGTFSAAFTYQSPQPPSITSISPVAGPAAGGTVVTISGAGFLNGATVKFGSAFASAVTFLNTTSLQAVTPPGTGTVDVTVTNPPNQSATRPNAFTYQAGGTPAVQAVLQGCRVGGTVTGLSSPQNYKIVMYVRTNQFYIQPCDTEPLNSISSNGSWGPLDSHSGDVYVLVVRSGYSPPAVADSLPQVDGINVLASTGPAGTLSGCDVSRCPAR